MFNLNKIEIDGKKSEYVFPNVGIFFDENSIRINNSKISGGNFYFSFIGVDAWISAMITSGSSSFCYELKGPNLGRMEHYSGYAAADMGSQRHPIESLIFSCEFSSEECSLEMKGTFGRVYFYKNEAISRLIQNREFDIKLIFSKVDFLSKIKNPASADYISDLIKKYSL